MNNKKRTVDNHLVQQAQAGQWEAFEALTTRHEKVIYSLAVRVLWDRRQAEEVTWKTFLVALERLEQLPRGTRFDNWLLSLATHEILNAVKERRERGTFLRQCIRHTTKGFRTRPGLAHGSLLRVGDKGFAPALLQTMLARLSESQQLLLLLRDVEGLSTEETAAALGISEDSVRTRVTRARCYLQNDLVRRLSF